MRLSEECFEAHLSLFEASSIETSVDRDESHVCELLRAPLFSSHIQRSLEDVPVTQYGLLGLQQSHHPHGFEMVDSNNECPNLIYGNHGEPWSAFICGSQGSGKSHTLASLLENCILPDHPLGKVPNPLTAIAFHFDPFTSFYSTQHCELAYFCSAGVKVRILVSSENIDTMKRLYANLPGLPANVPKPAVYPLKLTERQIDIANMMVLMNVKEDGHTPLYIATIHSILRKMKREQNQRSGIDYMKFKAELAALKFNESQLQMLKLRIQLLDECLEAIIPDNGKTGKERGYEDVWKFEPGSLTIVDLSSEFVNAGDACAFFTVCLNLFMARRCETGRVVVLDEAHKFLTMTGEAQKLTESLLSIIRQQRHLGTRVIIATQEPTLDTRLLDLCNVVIVHHFSSPAWFNVLKGHLAGSRGDKERSDMIHEIFRTIVKLKTGHALIFAPRAALHIQRDEVAGVAAVCTLGDGYMKMSIRPRVTADGGRSITAEDTVKIQEEEIMVTETEDGFESETVARGLAVPPVLNLVVTHAKEPSPKTQTAKPAAVTGKKKSAIPTEAQITEALRKVVLTLSKDKGKNANYDNYKKVRNLAAAELGTSANIFSKLGWKKKSNKLIKVKVAWRAQKVDERHPELSKAGRSLPPKGFQDLEKAMMPIKSTKGGQGLLKNKKNVAEELDEKDTLLEVMAR